MNAAICDAVPEDLAPLRAYRITDAVPQVTTAGTLHVSGRRVTCCTAWRCIDYGAKRNIVRELL